MNINFNGFDLNQVMQVLDVLQVKHKTLADNIANTNTPGYIRQDVNFRQELEKVLEQPSPAASFQDSGYPGQGLDALMAQDIEIQSDTSQPVKTDGNNVNLEQEMVDLSQTSQAYEIMTKLASNRFKLASYIVRGGH